MKPLRVLSLFDGISCGQVALERAGIPVEVYYASEIDKYAIQITQKNYPNTIQLGDVTKIDFTDFIGKIDLIMGGSPCQDLSIAGKRKGLSGERSGLFYKFVEAIEVIKPKYFLLENNYGMPQEAYEEMSRLMGCYPIMINSALVSAQTRKRFYWTNIGLQNYNLFGFPTVAIPQPKNKGILLKDILDSGLSYQEKSDCLTARYQGATFPHDYERNQRTMVAEPVGLGTLKGDKIEPLEKARTVTSYYSTGQTLEHTLAKNIHSMVAEPVLYSLYNQSTYKDKSATIGTNSHCATAKTGQMVIEPICVNSQSGRGDNPNASFLPNIAEPIRLQEYKKSKGQAQRVYSVKGKSVVLNANGGSQGGKTGLYKIDLPDGEYLIRKLTPLECERLQTLPDGYTEGVSATQRYKAIGNGWTVDVIAHIFSFIGD